MDSLGVEMTFDEAVGLVAAELVRAEHKHPSWPADMIYGAAIVAEEAGELIQAAIDYELAKGPAGPLTTEAVQTAAMGIRFLMNLGRDDK
jgi:molybdopterin biosynthesis enzyme